MKVGLMLPGLQSLALNEMAAKGAEALGLDSIWVPDHFLGPFHPELYTALPAASQIPDSDSYLDPFCISAVLGRGTSLTIGTCVTDTVRRRGADLARAALTLQECCGGEFVLGIGAGESVSLEPFGYESSRRVGRLAEALAEIRAVFDTGRLPDGGIGRIGLAEDGRPRPPKIWVGAGGPRASRLAGTYADGWMPLGISADQYGQLRVEVDAAASAAGRPSPEASLFAIILLARSKDDVVDLFERNPMAKQILLFAPASLWSRYGLDHPSGPDCHGHADCIPHALDPEVTREVVTRIPQEMVDEYVMCGSVEDVARQLSAYVAAGLEHVVLADLTGLAHPPDTVAELMPQLARLSSLVDAPSVSA
jgi:phthiodiolone/phenolphthiodiolone dimycocerosates ketoreductase